jgi:hypothetical protein
VSFISACTVHLRHPVSTSVLPDDAGDDVLVVTEEGESVILYQPAIGTDSLVGTARIHTGGHIVGIRRAIPLDSVSSVFTRQTNWPGTVLLAVAVVAILYGLAFALQPRT